MTYRESTITTVDSVGQAAAARTEVRSVPHTGRTLLVGPLPPPMTGTHVTFDIVCREARSLLAADTIDIIDTSQKHLKKHTRIASLGNLRQAGRILHRYRQAVGSCDRVLIFGSNGFLLSMAPILVWSAKRQGKPVCMRAFGGSLDSFHARLNPLARRLLTWTLRHVDALSVQTDLLCRAFTEQIGSHVRHTPGFRYLTDASEQANPTIAETTRPLRLTFVGLVREDKGVLILLESLKMLSRDGLQVSCDIHGPVWPAFADKFEQAMSGVENVEYKGVLDPADVVPTMAGYDALVFPTYYQGEGHPGVLIESMMAGIGAITTSFRSIPELITHQENGLLVPPNSPAALAEAIHTADADRTALAEMANRNWRRREEFDARRMVPLLLEQMGVPLSLR